MIDITKLTDRDVGRWVEYNVEYNFGSTSEKGRIKSWNDKYIFVVYKCDDNWNGFQNYTGCSTHPRSLNFSTK